MERPILFSTPMVKAILQGNKTQTRRIIKPQPDEDGLAKVINGPWTDTSAMAYKCPFGGPRDSLWVRETFSEACDAGPGHCPLYKADGDINEEYYKSIIPGWKWRPSIHMPRSIARIFLEVTSVRTERLQDITESDAIAEGVEVIGCSLKLDRFYKDYLGRNGAGFYDPIVSFESLWESVNGPESWFINPWVWVVEFVVTERPDPDDVRP